uniref:Zinc finger protein n=1 Tax=Kalanchoe fedtschenkoi TaxID=63787 RepID=A0A7N0RBR3_KALFE
MATPLTGVAAYPSVNQVDSASSANNNNKQKKSPILIFLFFHKAIRLELDALHRSALDFATGNCTDIAPLLRRYHFLRSIYKHHSNAEDEVIFPALDIRVKNVASAYSLEHKGESDLFDHLFDLLHSYAQSDETFARDVASCTGALQTSISQHMSKEEEQVLPLLIEKFTFEEQAALVWQFFCSIPVNMMTEFLPWLASSICADEHEDMLKCLRKIVPQEKLLQQVFFTWMNGKSYPNNSGDGDDKCPLKGCIDYESTASTTVSSLDEIKCSCNYSNHGKRKYLDSGGDIKDTSEVHPINEILFWHDAIRKELSAIAEEARKIASSVDYSHLTTFNERFQFVAQVCVFHSIAEDTVIFPAVDKELSFFQEHAEEESQFNKFRCIIENIQNAEASASSATEFYAKLCLHADQTMETIQRHFQNEEVQVLPLARKHFSFNKQRELLYQSLCMMPLKLIERVLPWLVGSLTENEARLFLQNLHYAAPAKDAALVTLFSGWACKGRSLGTCLPSSAIGCCLQIFSDIEEDTLQKSCACCSRSTKDNSWPVQQSDERPPKRSASVPSKTKVALASPEISDPNRVSCSDAPCCVPCLGVNRNSLGLSSLSLSKSMRSLSFNSSAPSLNSSLFVWETDNDSSDFESAIRPIDTIFKFHKAIRKDLEYLDMESGKLTKCDEDFSRHFIGRFRLLWGLYRAHSNAEDEIVFPALEAKEALHNIHEALNRTSTECKSTRRSSTSVELYSENMKKYSKLITKLQGMCKSIRVTLDQHIFREELELWPLFGKHFTVEEQDKIVGRIIGTTGAEVLQSMLPWVTSALTQDEQNKMMDTWKQATKNTMFNEWLNEFWKGSLVSYEDKISESSNPPEDDESKDSVEQNDQMFKPGWKDIFRMNQNELESEIRKVYRDSALDPRRKAYLVQNLLTSRWIAAQQKLPQETVSSNDEDVPGRSPDFRDLEKQVFGCEHYKRNCKLRAVCCGKLFTCRFCHDKVSDHSMERKATTEMMCMSCLEIQPVGPVCSTPSCNGYLMANYYCNICKFFDDQRSIYHCPFCNLCRVGKGLGIDYFHCMTCNCCLGMKLVDHKCLEKSLETNCPICCDFLFTSSAAVRALPCGHYMHSACFQAYTCSHYTCPICSKSMGDMAVYFGMLDALLAAEELPEEYRNHYQDILCNDCGSKGSARFHWLYHKCGSCASYNTRVIKNETASYVCPNLDQ